MNVNVGGWIIDGICKGIEILHWQNAIIGATLEFSPKHLSEQRNSENNILKKMQKIVYP